MAEDKKTTLFLLGNYYAFFVTGAFVLMTGAVMPYLLRDYQLGYDQGGTLLMLQAVGNLAASVLGGIASAYVGRRTVLIFGSLSFALGYGGVVLTSSPAAIYIFLIISGFGVGIINNLSNVVVSERTDGDPGIINILHMSFGIGAFLAPFIVSAAVGAGLGWKAAMAVLSVLALILAWVFIRIDLPEPDDKKEKEQGRSRISLAFLKDIRYYVFMLIIFFYVGTENSINGWLTSYILDTGIGDGFAAQRLLAVTWLAVIAGRLSCVWLSKHLSRETMLFAGGAGSLLFFILLIVSKNILLVYAAVIGIGFFLAGIYPNTVANAAYLIGGSGTAAGLLFACGGLGTSFIPYLVGLRAETGGMEAGMLTLVGSLLLFALFCTLNLVISKYRSRARQAV